MSIVITPPRNLRHALKSLVPNWMADNPNGLNVTFAVLFAIALMGDLFIEAMTEGVFAAWPGAGTTTSLPLIGRSRGFIRGVAETDDAYAARLRAWLDTWPEAGSDALLVRLIQNYLGGNLVVRAVDRRGKFTTIDSGGVITTTIDATWNFDATENPERVGWWSDLWVIVYLDGRWATYASLSDAGWLAAWGTTLTGTGHAVPAGIADDIKVILSVFKGAHSYVEALVFTTDTSIFVPGSLGVTYPDGRWGNWSRVSGGVEIPARATVSGGGVIRYWIPAGGG